jgi:Caspase domain
MSYFTLEHLKDYIVNVHGFPEGNGNMTILIDDDDFKHPTFMNIVEAFKVLSEESKPGDAVFVLFSGHGGRVLDAPQDAESYDEVILPYDFKQSGLIRDTLIFKTLVAPMRYGVTLTVMIDCCDTGMVFDMPYAWDVNSKSPSEKESVASPVVGAGKMTMNENFSFVRFLKVIKTLYEASTFTQLGKTVGSALKPTSIGSPRSPRSNRGDAGTNGDRNAVSSTSGEDAEMDVASERYTSKQDSMVPSHESILDVITEACRPVRRHQQSRNSGATANGKLSKRDDNTPRQSLLEQVINCTLLAPPEEDYLSDEDTFRTRTYDDEVASDAVVESFETLTEDEEDFKRSRSSRRKKR